MSHPVVLMRPDGSERTVEFRAMPAFLASKAMETAHATRTASQVYRDQMKALEATATEVSTPEDLAAFNAKMQELVKQFNACIDGGKGYLLGKVLGSPRFPKTAADVGNDTLYGVEVLEWLWDSDFTPAEIDALFGAAVEYARRLQLHETPKGQPSAEKVQAILNFGGTPEVPESSTTC